MSLWLPCGLLSLLSQLLYCNLEDNGYTLKTDIRLVAHHRGPNYTDPSCRQPNGSWPKGTMQLQALSG